MGSSNLRNLRPVERPHDHELDDPTWVQRTDLEWSLLVQGARMSGFAAAIEVAEKVATDVRRQQQLRRDADLRDAHYDDRGA